MLGEHHMLFIAVKSVSAQPDNPAQLSLQSTFSQYTHTPHIYIQTHTCKTECILKGFIIPLASIISTVLNLEGTVCISTVLFTLFLDNSN